MSDGNNTTPDAVDADRPKQIKAGIAALRQSFGRFVNEDVLTAVLEMFSLDVAQATKFLEGSDKDGQAVSLQHFDPKKAATQPVILPHGYLDFANAVGSAAASASTSTENASATSASVESASDKLARLKRLLIETSTYGEHLAAVREDFAAYFACLVSLLRLSVDVKGNAPRALAALWAMHKFGAADFLLQTSAFSLPEVLRALAILDGPRRIRALEKRMSRLQRNGTVRPFTLQNMTSTMNDLKREPVEQGSVSGALAARVCHWVSLFPERQLLFFCLQLPKEPWKQLADMIHVNPSKHLRVPWFLSHAFGQPLPENLPITAALNLTNENSLETITQLRIPYAYLHMHKDKLSDEAKAVVAGYEQLDTLIWWYEELRCPAVDAVMTTRLTSANAVLTLGYGHLLDRLLLMRTMQSPLFDLLVPLAERRLRDYKLSMKAPVVCFGDASSSMDVAIRVATITASFMTALVAADLCFFRTDVDTPAVMPRSIADVVRVAVETRASGMTSPAAALWPYYDEKIALETIIVVTDEEENTKSHGFFFAQLFAKYREEVAPNAKIIMVSFLQDPQRPGRMTQALAQVNIRPMLRIALDARRPDLSKLDGLLGLLSLESAGFAADWELLKQAVGSSAEQHLQAALQRAVADAGIVLTPNQDLVE